MAGRKKHQTSTYSLRQIWPLRRTLLGCGIVAYAASLAAVSLPLWTVFLPVALFLLFLLTPLRQPHRLLLCGVLALFWLSGAAYRHFHISPLTAQSGQTDTLIGWIEECPDSGSLYTLRVTDAALVPSGTRVMLYCPDEYAPAPYQVVRCTARLTATADYQASYRSRGIHLLAFPSTQEIALTEDYASPPPLHCLMPLRDYLCRRLRQQLPGDEGAILAALCLGKSDGLSEDINDAFRDSGLSHLLVVSGLHLSLLTAAVAALLCRLRLSRRLAAAITIPVVVFFMLLIGPTPSVIRAGTMCLVWLAGLLSRHRGDGLNSLGFAALLLVGANPYTATSVGFLLSFFATAGILFLMPRVYAHLPSSADPTDTPLRRFRQNTLRSILISLAVCGSATLFTLPLSCYYFGGFPLITPIANLLAVTPGSGALLCGWVGTLLCGVPFLSFLGKPILLLAGILTKITRSAATLCATLSTRVTVNELWQLILAVGGCILIAVAIRRGNRRLCRTMVAGLTAVTLLACGVDHTLSAPLTTVTAVSAGYGEAVLVRNGRQSGLLVTRSSGLRDAANLLYTMGCVRLDYLLVGKGDPAETGGLTHLLRQVAVERVLVTDAATWTLGTASAVTALSCEDRLCLGEVIWTYHGNGWQLDTPDTHLTIGGDETATVTTPPDGTPIQYLAPAKDWRKLLWL